MRFSWELFRSGWWKEGQRGSSWGLSGGHRVGRAPPGVRPMSTSPTRHTAAGTAGPPGRPRAARSRPAPRGSSGPSPPPPAPSRLPRPPLPAPAGAEGRSGHGRRRRRQRWVSARGVRRSGTRRDRTCPERRGRQRGRGGGDAIGGCSGKGGTPGARGAARIGGSGSGAAGIEHRSSEPAGAALPSAARDRERCPCAIHHPR